jgi:Ca2+-transporting ATPase
MEQAEKTSSPVNGSRKWHEVSIGNVLKILGTTEKGLTEPEAKTRLGKYGLNEIKRKRKISKLKILLSQFTSPLVIILIIATILSALIGEILDAIVILVILIFNAAFGFFQEYKAEKTIEALKKLTAPEAMVVREGKIKRITSSMLVPGDMVMLEQGARIPADMRITKEVELKIDESALTGESVPVSKRAEGIKCKTLAEMASMAFMGTIVTYGRGYGVVVNTGMKTEIGKIAKMVEEAEEQATPLQERLADFAKKLGFIVIAISVIVIVIGIFRGHALMEMITTGIALAVAAIPEGLPAVVTITLAIGLKKLAKHNALIKKLPAVEALGSTSVICADKTGTLTKNEMTVRKIWYKDKLIEVTGKGFEPVGDFLFDGKELDPVKDKTLTLLLRTGTLCSNAELEKSETGTWEIVGDPTEGALVVLSEKAKLEKTALEKDNPRMYEVPFTSERKMMSTVNRTGSKNILYVKGAPETILDLCTEIYENGKVIKLARKTKESILELNQNLANEALRVLAFAYREVKTKTNWKQDEKTDSKLERDLIFVGLGGMIDPPRPDVKENIKLCSQAGIKAVMITGDHKNTALAIAKEIEMFKEGDRSLTGAEMDSISDEELANIVEKVSVYARVDPKHKVRIVSAFKKKGHIIAMTGDGVNDAPALKNADIGIAMGIKGTDVAKEASDMILADDDFSNIVRAVESGRHIYDNIKKFIYYLLSSNIGEVMVVFLAMLIFIDPSGSALLPLLAVHLLWINLVTDGPPALALGVDPPSPDLMSRLPRDPKEKILSKGSMRFLIMVGVIMCIGTLGVFWWGLGVSIEKARTLAFTTLVIYEMFNVINCRSLKYSMFKIGVFSNRKLIYAIAASIILQLLVIYVPAIQIGFKTVALGLLDWVVIVAVSSTVLIISQLKIKLFGGFD